MQTIDDIASILRSHPGLACSLLALVSLSVVTSFMNAMLEIWLVKP